MDRVKRIRYLSPMRAAKVQASLRIRAVSPEPPLLAHTSSESRGTFRQKARSLAPLNGWACAVKICHNGMLEDTNSLGAAHISIASHFCKQSRPRSGSSNGLLTGISIQNKIKKSTPDTPKIGNGLVQLIKMDASIRQMWVEFHSTE